MSLTLSKILVAALALPLLAPFFVVLQAHEPPTAPDAVPSTITESTTEVGSSGISENAPRKVEPDWVDSYDTLLGKYVTPKGVRYAAWHKNKEDRIALTKVIAAIATANLKGKTRDEKLAFLLNAYNAYILHRILGDYPTDGPGGGGFFGRNKFFKANDVKVAGGTASFYTLENSLIRPKFKEPRIHFALNCASKSCPPLHSKAFRGETLNTTLSKLTNAFINENPNGVKATKGGKKLKVSKIFDWYEEDFAGGVVAYINQFRGKARYPAKAKVSYQSYDWSLNEAK